MNIASYIEHHALKPVTTITDIELLCNESLQYDFAAVCVPPLFVKKAKLLLDGSKVKVATVAGFPLGHHAIEAKLAETVLAIVDGADELNMVINIMALKNADWQYLAKEINTIMPVIKNNGKVIKVIIETGVLTNEEIITCCDIYGAGGVDFIETSTGYAENEVTPETVKLIRSHLADAIQIKASGDIFTGNSATEMIAAGAVRISCSNCLQIVKSLTDNKDGMIFENGLVNKN